MSKSVRLAQKLTRHVGLPVAELPVFLCPGLLGAKQVKQLPYRRCLSDSSQRRLLTSITPTSRQNPVADLRLALRRLPQQCVGCGALAQNVDEGEAGFYTLSRKSVRRYLDTASNQKQSSEDAIVKAALQQAQEASIEVDLGDFARPEITVDPPVCDRCHQIRHHDSGVSIHHPSVQSIQDTIFESPYKYNHVYHVLDAADFPMSLVPGLHKLLHLTPLRSRNRRSKTGRFYNGRKTEVSFVITRSDLLAPQKTQVDSMMPYLRAVLRDALGRSAKDVRLGNIRCVSAKQAWWTKELKEEIWKRGGGGWMVGKVNVGKSQLFHNIFPKGRSKKDKPLLKRLAPPNPLDVVTVPGSGVETSLKATTDEDPALKDEVLDIRQEHDSTKADSLDTSSLLPPVPPEEDYPAMPLVSSLPGTTASPIRLSFGNGKGELIDLPGLSRGDFELHVQPEHRSELVMRARVRPEQKVIKHGQSLLLGGFIRITPTTPDLIILAYAFTPINAHLTATEKAINTQMHNGSPNVQNISLPETAEKIKSAGTFPLKWDVTKERSGPITRPGAVGISPERLPYKVLATDILIEGCGWVELVAQVRKRIGDPDLSGNRAADWEAEDTTDHQEIDPSWPAVEVFTPNGKFVSSRRPMNAWLNFAQKPGASKMKGRPRKAMKGRKKIEKRRTISV